MQIFSSWDSVSTKAEDWHFCLEHRLCSQAWQSESFGDKQCNVQSLVRSLCSPRPRLPDHLCCTAVCSLLLLPSRASQLFHSERKSRYGWQDGLLPSHSEQAVYECKMHPVASIKLRSSQHYPTSFLCHLTAPNSLVSCPLSWDTPLQ